MTSPPGVSRRATWPAPTPTPWCSPSAPTMTAPPPVPWSGAGRRCSPRPADVLAFPSTKEGWGLAVLEAMSAGLPVVTSDLPVFREYLSPGRDALLVPVDDAPALAAALAAILDDPELADRLRSAAGA